jgi:hypothetical protein
LDVPKILSTYKNSLIYVAPILMEKIILFFEVGNRAIMMHITSGC